MSADNAYGQAWQEVTFGYCGFGWSQTNGSSTDLLVTTENVDNYRKNVEKIKINPFFW